MYYEGSVFHYEDMLEGKQTQDYALNRGLPHKRIKSPFIHNEQLKKEEGWQAPSCVNGI